MAHSVEFFSNNNATIQYITILYIIILYNIIQMWKWLAFDDCFY